MVTKVTTEYRVIYADTDAMSVVYYANYFQMFERGRTVYFREIGYPYKEFEKASVAFPVIEAYCEYRRPAKNDDLLEIITWLSKITYTKVWMRNEVRLKETGELLVSGHTVHALVGTDLKPIRPSKVIPEFYAKLQSLAEED